MRATTQAMRWVREDRINKMEESESLRKRMEDKKQRLQREYAEMRKVVVFFYDNCPCEISDELRQTIEKTLFNGKGSKNKLGVINFLNSLIFNQWPEWLSIAKEEFKIDF